MIKFFCTFHHLVVLYVSTHILGLTHFTHVEGEFRLG